MPPDQRRLDVFLALSAALTGFSVFRLTGTGQAQPYLRAASDVVGEATMDELLDRFRGIPETPGEDRDRQLRAEILSHPKLGPLARNIIKIWFVGTWYQLPPEWRDAFGTNPRDVTFVVSPAAYTEGLLWPAIGANPPGAKAPGYGTWADPPRIPH